MPSSAAPPALQVAAWQRVPHLVHGFFGRRGGGSSGSYSSLNLSYAVGDNVAAVDENWARVRDRGGAAIAFATMRQVHGAHVAEVGAAGSVGEADAMLTSAAGVGLCVLTADCVPLLIVAPGAHAVAAVHAGWRGTLAGVAAQALRSLAVTYAVEAGNVHVALGPAVGRCCYEVDAAIADDLEGRWHTAGEALQRYTLDGEAKAKLDLRRANVAILVEAGVAPDRISVVGGCTCCEVDQYFSHRAAAKSGGTTGRQLSFIGWSA